MREGDLLSDERHQERGDPAVPGEGEPCGTEAEVQEILHRPAPPLLVVISGPSGVGKDAVLARMKELKRPYHFVVTATTRPKRPREVEGVDYHFVSTAEFQQMLEREEFMEWANVYGNLYGVPKEQVRQALASGRDVLVKPDVQGAATIKQLVPEAVFIFLAPPSLEDLARRLRQRKTESPAQLELRLRTARREMACLFMFDYLVLNKDGQLDDTVAHIEAIIRAEKSRVRPRVVRL